VVIILNGPLSIGKTETGWKLLGALDRAAMIDGDCVAALRPFAHYNERGLGYAYETPSWVGTI
jgi:hypothetical protein